MASKQVSEILIKLGLRGLEGLDKLKSSFRELEKSLGPSAETIERARESIIAFGREGRNTEQVIKGQIEALRGLQSQTERGSTAWAELAGDIERFRQASRRTDDEIQVLRQSILSVATGANQSQQSLRSYITDLGRLRGEATITGSVFNDLGRDIAELTAQLQQAETQTIQTSRAFGRVLGQALASTSAGARRQLQDLRLLIDEQREIVDGIDQQSARERRLAENIETRAAAQERLNRALTQQRQLMYEQSVRAGRESVRIGAAAFAEDSGLFDFRDAARRFGDLPDTTAALNQELAELSERLLNTNRSSSAYVNVSNRIAEVQRELRREITGTASSFDQLARSQAAASRQMSKRAAIEEYYAPTDLLAPGIGGYRDPRTGAMIMAGAPTPDRIRVDEAAYPTPIGPQPFPEMGRRAQESIERALDDVNRIYEDARVRRAEIQSKYDQIQIDKMLEGLDLEGRVREKGFRDELAAFDKQLEARDRRRRGRLTTGQAVQSAGAIISGGIFGGPEGFLGGLGGFAAGLAIPGLGPVGGAFAGAAAGAQIGGLRQAAGAAAEYAAEIRRLQLALQGVVYSFEDYRSALGAIESASQQFNIPILQSTQQFTKLTAAVIGSGGTIKDAENTFKGLSASVLATGGSIQDVNGALVAAAQVFSKGKVSAEELRGQIGERLAGAFALFAESSGKSTKELDADLQAGEVTLAQFVQFVEFSLKKYGRTAQIIADSPEQAGARLDLALKNLQKNIGNALGPSGAAFQDFAARSIRGIDRVINKLIELRAIQPGAGFYQEQVLGKRMSIEQLEKAVLRAGARESELRAELADVGLGFFANLLPEVAKASKEVKILEEALVKLRLIEKETNKERKQRQDDEAKAEKEKLGQQYLQAVEQREEALFNARRQREEQIATIRKNAIEQAAKIEQQLGDERRQIERDIERTRREMEFGAGELDRLRRLAAGEDPEVIEAERKAAEISQRATEDRIRVEEDLLDKELTQQRTIADFQKNTAKQIADANENYAKRVGEIQRDFAKASAKIIEEGSGVAAKRITLAAQIVSQVLQRSAINQQQVVFGATPISEPIGFRNGQPVYREGGDIPPQLKIIDMKLEQLLRKLTEVRPPQSSIPGRRVGSTGIGEQFLGLLGAERGYEDVAGLLPLPIQRMQQPGIESKFEGAMLPGGSFNISRLARNFGSIASASGASPLQYFPAIAQNIRGAAPTTQMRRQATQQRLEQIDQQALIKAYEVLSQVKSSSAQTLENFQLQNREIELQIQNLSDGMEPELASQLSGLQSNYEVQQQQLEIQRQALINQGLNAEAVNQAYVAESEALARIYEQNQAAIAQYREKQKVLEAIQNTSTILESNLTSAISNSIEVLVTGSGTVKQVLADMFKSIGQAFIQMAAQIIAKQLVMVTLGSIMKALGLTAGASSGGFSGGYFDPATGLGAAGPNFGLAKGGYFAGGMVNLPSNSIKPFANGGIVTKPTFFKFANGGTMSNGVMGEAGPEAVMPLKRGADGKLGVAARLDGAMKRYRSTPGSAAAIAEGDSAAMAAAGAATMEPIDVRYSVERINNVDYVTADQFQRGMAQAAQQGAVQGERRALRSLKNSSATRRSLAI